MPENEEIKIPGSGAVYTFGKCQLADNILNHFYIRDDPIIDIGCGDEHTVILCGSGRAFSFGYNEWGQLGLGHCSAVKKPSCIKTLKPMKSLHVTCGRSHTLVLTGSGYVYAFGNNSDGQLGIGSSEDADIPQLIDSLSNVQQLAAGCHHSVALTGDGKVFVWGSNSDGQLGLGKQFQGPKTPYPLQLDHHILRIACGYYHTVMITDEGRLIVCGEGESGKLGLGDTLGRDLPTYVSSQHNFTDVSAGGHHTVAITDQMQVLVWGSNELGQIGLGEVLGALTPTLVPTLANILIKGISCGESHSAFLTDDGQLLVCGETRHGKLGLDTMNGKQCQREPTEVKKFTNYHIYKVQCGGCHTEVLAIPLSGCEDKLDEGSSKGLGSLSSSNSSGRRLLPPLQKLSLTYCCQDPLVSSTSVGSQNKELAADESVQSASSNALSECAIEVNNKESYPSFKEKRGLQHSHRVEEDNKEETDCYDSSILSRGSTEVSCLKHSCNRKCTNRFKSLNRSYKLIEPNKWGVNSEWPFCSMGEFENAFHFYRNRECYRSLPNIHALSYLKNYNFVKRLIQKKVKKYCTDNIAEKKRLVENNNGNHNSLKRKKTHYNLTNNSISTILRSSDMKIFESSSNFGTENIFEGKQSFESNLDNISEWIQSCDRESHKRIVYKSKCSLVPKKAHNGGWDTMFENDSNHYNRHCSLRKCSKNIYLEEESIDNNNNEPQHDNYEFSKKKTEQGYGRGRLELKTCGSSNSWESHRGESIPNGLVEKNETETENKGQLERKTSRFFSKMKKSTSQLIQNSETCVPSTSVNSSVHNKDFHKKSKMCVII